MTKYTLSGLISKFLKRTSLSGAEKSSIRGDIGAQETLASGTNIKTIGATGSEQSLLGSGNLTPANIGAAGLATANTFAESQVMNGTQNLMANQLADDPASVMNRGLSDTRYNQVFILRLTSQTTSDSTNYVDSSTTLTLEAGTYEFRGNIFGITASTTAGVQVEIAASPSPSETYAYTVLPNSASSSVYASNVAVLGRAIFGASQTFANVATAFIDGGANGKTAKAFFSGLIVLTQSTIFTPRVKQRTTTDASNPTAIDVGTHCIFRKIS